MNKNGSYLVTLYDMVGPREFLDAELLLKECGFTKFWYYSHQGHDDLIYLATGTDDNMTMLKLKKKVAYEQLHN